MANRRCLLSLPRVFQSFKALDPIPQPILPASALALHQAVISNPINHIFDNAFSSSKYTLFSRYFSSSRSDDEEDEDIEGSEEEEDIEGSEEEEEIEEEEARLGSRSEKTNLSVEDKENEAAEIGYKIIGPLQESDRIFKLYEPVFAVVQIGSHQFKVSNGDCIYTERLKFCDVNDKLILNKVLMLGSRTRTIIGRPMLPDAAVHAIVEEHALDAKVLIFKKKRRKNYRRTRGHRQELTKLRITDIQGIKKPENTISLKTEKEKLRKLAVEA